jgi:hypothetical protein
LARFTLEFVLKDFDPKNITPRHGPGAVATGERLEEKWVFSRLYDDIHQYYPYYDYFVVGGADELADRLEWYKSLLRVKSGTAKVVLVPKDSRGPRLISAEPLEFQWIQQGLGRKLMSHLEGHWLTRGNINFRDQSVNQQFALDSSIDKSFATVDLQDASDLVSLSLVQFLFQRNSEFLRAISACRSSSTVLPDGVQISLKKFAPMGSALCFPVEALIFWAICVSSIARRLHLTPHKCGKMVKVYGDDIIVPTEHLSICIESLESVGLRVNRHKTFSQGYFRESCGVDAYKGVVVTPLRLRTPWSGKRSDGSAYAAYVSLAIAIAGDYPSAHDYLVKKIEEIYGRVPYGLQNSPFPCLVVESYSRAELLNKQRFKSRFNRKLQKIEFYLPVLSSRKKALELDDWPRLMRDLISPQKSDPSIIVLPRSMQIKRRWSGLV